MGNGGRILMKDVAARAGVHQTTVSMALRGHPGIPERTRERIRKLAEEMGYHPDPALRALNSYRKRVRNQAGGRTFAYILNLPKEEENVDNHVYSEHRASVRDRAVELGYNVEIFRFGKENLTAGQLDRILKARGIQGVLLGAFTLSNGQFKLDWASYAVVKIDLLPVELEADSVLSNQMFAVRLAMQRIKEDLGFMRIGLAVAEHDELHNRNLFMAGYSIAQRQFAEADRVPACIFKAKAASQVSQEVKAWARANRVEVILSNWNNLDLAAAEVSLEESRPCRFVPLDANKRTRRYGGIDQNHRQIARWAVDLLDGKLTSFKLGLPETHGMTLVDPVWIPFGKWDEKEVARKAAIELRPPREGKPRAAYPDHERLTPTGTVSGARKPE